MTDQAITEQTTAETDAPAGPSLSVSDIQNAIRIIDFASEQGAFKGWNTIEQVLIVRNRLNDFLRAVLPPEEKAEEGDASGTEQAAG